MAPWRRHAGRVVPVHSAAITPDFYVKVCQDAAAQLDATGQVKALAVHPKLLGAWQMSGGVWLKDRLTPGLPTAPAFVGKDGSSTRRSSAP